MMRNSLVTLVAAAVVAVVAGCNGGGNAPAEGSAPTVERAEDLFSKVGGWIVFRSGSNIVAIDPSSPKDTLVLAPALDDDPIAWSSDGTKLLLRSRQEERGVPVPGLFVLHPDGSRITLLPEANDPSWDPPTWGSFSPDGTEVVYAGSGRSRGPYIIDADGGTPRSLADPCPRQEVQGELMELCGEPAREAAAWSPDGSTIAWLDLGEGTIPGVGHENFLSFVNPDGTGLREGVATLPGTFGGYSLVWSPDGSQLAFWMADDDDRNAQIFVINADGTGPRQVTHEGENHWPTWSPDGSRIAFVHNGALYTMAPDGTDMQRVDGVTPDGAIAWNPVR